MTPQERFLQYFELDTKPEPGASGEVPPAEQIRQMSGQAVGLEARSPPPALPDKTRDQMRAKRSPLLGSLLRRCADGLEADPEAAAGSGVKAQTCRNTAQLDDAATSLVKNAGDTYAGTGDAVRICAGQARVLGERVLFTVARQLQSPGPTTDVVMLRTLFTPALLQYSESRARSERGQAAVDKATAGHKARTESAQAREAAARAIDGFVTPEEE